MPQKISIRIDGEYVSATEGQTILEAARASGKVHPHALLPGRPHAPRARCRLCIVEVSGVGRLLPACTTPVQNGMSVTTNSEKLTRYRRMALEFLLIERNHYCSVCVSNGHCELQAMAQQLGVTHVNYPYNYPRMAVDVSHDRYVLDHNRCILCTRCVRVCAEVEGAHVWNISGRGIQSRLVSDLNQPWGESKSCTSCGKCVQVCPTGALAEKGWAVEEMVKNNESIRRLGHAARRSGMNKVKLATVWLDGCSGCHMSLLDIDEAIAAVARGADMVYGPLVDAQEFPEGVDVTLVEGAVSSHDDLEKIRIVRERSRIVVALGDCAITSNVPGMRNPIPVRQILERVYIEGADAEPGVPTRGRAAVAQARRADPRSGEGGHTHSRLPAAGADHPVRGGRAAQRAHAGSRFQGEVRLGVSAMKRITIDPVTRIEGHAKITIHLDEDGQGRRTRSSTSPSCAASRSSPRAGRFTRCPRSRRASAASARSATCWRRPRPATPSWPCASPRPRPSLRELIHCAQFVQSHALSFFHLSAPDLLLGFDSDPAQAQHIRACSRSIRTWRATASRCASSASRIIEGLAKERIHPSWIVPGGVNAPLAPEVRDRDPRRPARRQGHRAARAGAL